MRRGALDCCASDAQQMHNAASNAIDAAKMRRFIRVVIGSAPSDPQSFGNSPGSSNRWRVVQYRVPNKRPTGR
jgi:hypothetical protein